MSYGRTHRKDANQDAIIAAIEKVGGVVTRLSQLGDGVSDLLVSFRQKWFVFEVKTEAGELNEKQRKWVGAQRAPVYVVKDPMQAIGFLQDVRP